MNLFYQNITNFDWVMNDFLAFLSCVIGIFQNEPFPAAKTVAKPLPYIIGHLLLKDPIKYINRRKHFCCYLTPWLLGDVWHKWSLNSFTWRDKLTNLAAIFWIKEPFTYSSSYNPTPAISRVLIGQHLTFFCPTWSNAATLLKNVRRLNLRRDKKPSFQLSHSHMRLVDNFHTAARPDFRSTSFSKGLSRDSLRNHNTREFFNSIQNKKK